MENQEQGRRRRRRQAADEARPGQQQAFPSGSMRGFVPPAQAQPGPGGSAGQAPQQAFYTGQPDPRYYPARTQGYYQPPAQPVRPAPKPKRSRRLLWLIVPLIALMVVLGINAYRAEEKRADAERYRQQVHAKTDPYDSVFCPGVYVDGIHLGGMSPQEAMDAVEARIRQNSGSWSVRLTYGSNYKDITAGMMNFTTDVGGVLQEAWNRGHTGDTEQRYNDMLLLEQEPYYGYTAKPSGDTRVIDGVLETVKRLVDKPPKDARMIGINKDNISDPFVYEEEEYGLSLDIEPLRQKLYQMVSVMESGTLEIVPDRVKPAVCKADLTGRYSLRASAWTKISTSSDENRNNNIRHALQDFVNGYRLEPGQAFSFNKVVGERTEARGFFPADEIVSGEMVEGYGGGVCQASTTLFQAAVCAGLQIVTRQPHSEKVRYTELGLDATVYLSKNRNKDLVFKNNTDSDIYIFAVVEKDPTEKKKNRLRARVDIYGADMGDVEYEMKSVIVETVDPPAAEIRKDKKGQYVTYKDEQYLYSEAQPGYKVNVYLTEKRSRQEIWLYTDEYPAKRAVYYEGVKNR